MSIKLLDKNTCELIAAGEVVERPASVVKELVENSLDAGARKVEIELRGGGLSLIRVGDDGCGIAPDDVRRAFLRHATSKIDGAADLDAITSLGFRGEALAAIASVSRARMITRSSDEADATQYELEGGEEISFGGAGAPVGTTIWISDLFYNTPARMKFLKKDVHEGNAVQQIVEQLALSRPDVAFRLIREGRVAFATPGDGKLYSAAFCVLPREVAEQLVELVSNDERARVSGFVSRPSAARASRSLQYLFVNGRAVRSRSISAAAEEACRGLVPSGKRPAFIINVELPPGEVDVNVHPAKTEVRFRSERDVSSAVYGAVKLALESAESIFSPLAATAEPPRTDLGGAPVAGRVIFSSRPSGEVGAENTPEIPAAASNELTPSAADSPAGGAAQGFDKTGAEQENMTGGNAAAQANANSADAAARFFEFALEGEAGRDSAAHTLRQGEAAYRAEPTAQSLFTPAFTANQDEGAADYGGKYENTALAGFSGGDVGLKILGEVLGVYIVAATSDALVLIDKHAAHERLLFEKLRASQGGVDRQLLAEPLVISLGVSEKQTLLDAQKELERIGFVVEEFGERELAVREIPTYMSLAAARDAVSELAERLLGAAEPDTTAREWLLHSSACRAAIKAGHKTNGEEIARLVGEIISAKIPLRCPHGRPVYITLDRRELERRFGRIQ